MPPPTLTPLETDILARVRSACQARPGAWLTGRDVFPGNERSNSYRRNVIHRLASFGALAGLQVESNGEFRFRMLTAPKG